MNDRLRTEAPMEKTITAADGRALRLELAGDLDGPVIVYHHGTPMSRRLFGAHMADVEAKDACLVGYDRPGYGGSTRNPGRSVADAVADVRAIATDLGKERVVTWGISGGGPHALACAALAPDLIAAAASLAAPAPYGAQGLDYFAGMGELNVEDMKLALSDPEAYEKKAVADAEEMRNATVDEMIKQLESLLSEVDLNAFSGELAAFLAESAHIGLASGPDGYLDDDSAFLRSWGFDPADIAVPVLLWQGRHDRFVPFQHGEWLADRVPGVEAHLSDIDGHLTLFGRVPDVHDWLLSHLD
jgi:pimeloyl-ACP methyl ester carboxylesterase